MPDTKLSTLQALSIQHWPQSDEVNLTNSILQERYWTLKWPCEFPRFIRYPSDRHGSKDGTRGISAQTLRHCSVHFPVEGGPRPWFSKETAGDLALGGTFGSVWAYFQFLQWRGVAAYSSWVEARGPDQGQDPESPPQPDIILSKDLYLSLQTLV